MIDYIGTDLGNDSLVADMSPISEELNVAYAQHEIVGAVTGYMIAWLEAKGEL